MLQAGLHQQLQPLSRPVVAAVVVPDILERRPLPGDAGPLPLAHKSGTAARCARRQAACSEEGWRAAAPVGGQRAASRRHRGCRRRRRRRLPLPLQERLLLLSLLLLIPALLAAGAPPRPGGFRPGGGRGLRSAGLQRIVRLLPGAAADTVQDFNGSRLKDAGARQLRRDKESDRVCACELGIKQRGFGCHYHLAGEPAPAAVATRRWRCPFQWFLMALSVRPGRNFEMVAQRLPSSVCFSMMMRSCSRSDDLQVCSTLHSWRSASDLCLRHHAPAMRADAFILTC